MIDPLPLRDPFEEVRPAHRAALRAGPGRAAIRAERAAAGLKPVAGSGRRRLTPTAGAAALGAGS